jgi:hypothetical protein
MRRCSVVVWALAGCGDVKNAAPPVEVTLSQTNSSSLVGSLGCRTNTDEYVRDQSFYRAFALDDYDVTGEFTVKRVDFGVSAASGGTAPSQPLVIAVYGYTGTIGGPTIDLTKLSTPVETPIQVADTTVPMIIPIPVMAKIPEGTGGLVVELRVEDGVDAMRVLMFGANFAGERSPGYHRAPPCGYLTPVSIPAEGNPTYALVLSVIGES